VWIGFLGVVCVHSGGYCNINEIHVRGDSGAFGHNEQCR
jgi:hypothetical protein